MSAAHGRLDRMLPGLSFDERLDALLAAYHQDRRPDRNLFTTMPASDNGRWNEAARILNGLHRGLGWYIDYVEACVTQLELRFALAEQARITCFLFEGDKRAEMERIADALVVRLVAELVPRWQEVRLAELALDYFGEQLGGRELLHPESAATLSDCHRRLIALHEALAAPGRVTVYEFELTEPTEAGLTDLVNLLISDGRLL